MKQAYIFELAVFAITLGMFAQNDVRTVNAIRTILNAVGVKLRRRFTLEILN
jgi:predicted RNA-binding protein YlqC (UPF0109 family)